MDPHLEFDSKMNLTINKVNKQEVSNMKGEERLH